MDILCCMFVIDGWMDVEMDLRQKSRSGAYMCFSNIDEMTLMLENGKSKEKC